MQNAVSENIEQYLEHLRLSTAVDLAVVSCAKESAPEYGVKVHLGDSSYETHLIGRYWWTQNSDKLVPVEVSGTTFESEDLAWMDVARRLGQQFSSVYKIACDLV